MIFKVIDPSPAVLPVDKLTEQLLHLSDTMLFFNLKHCLPLYVFSLTLVEVPFYSYMFTFSIRHCMI